MSVRSNFIQKTITQNKSYLSIKYKNTFPQQRFQADVIVTFATKMVKMTFIWKRKIKKFLSRFTPQAGLEFLLSLELCRKTPARMS